MTVVLPSNISLAFTLYDAPTRQRAAFLDPSVLVFPVVMKVAIAVVMGVGVVVVLIGAQVK